MSLFTFALHRSTATAHAARTSAGHVFAEVDSRRMQEKPDAISTLYRMANELDTFEPDVAAELKLRAISWR